MSKLVPRVFIIEQKTNEHTYFVQRVNLAGKFRWYLTLSINGMPPDFLPGGKDRKGFKSPEDALAAWQKNYEPTL